MVRGKTIIESIIKKLGKRRDGFREIAIIGLIYGAYRMTSASLGGNDILAFQNAYNILDLETDLGFFVEFDFQSHFLGSSFLIHLVNSIYTFFYYPVLVLFAVWAFNRHREQYYIVRNIFAISAVLAFICFAVYPVAPPRLLPYPGFVDTMAQYGVFNYGSSGVSSMMNPYAAMPSLHFGWALLFGAAIIFIAKPLWAKCLGAIIPIGMFVAIVATGNHFILDAIGGAAIILLSYLTVRVYDALRERVVFRRQAGIISD